MAFHTEEYIFSGIHIVPPLCYYVIHSQKSSTLFFSKLPWPLLMFSFVPYTLYIESHLDGFLANYDVIRVEKKTAEFLGIISSVQKGAQNREKNTSGDYLYFLGGPGLSVETRWPKKLKGERQNHPSPSPPPLSTLPLDQDCPPFSSGRVPPFSAFLFLVIWAL